MKLNFNKKAMEIGTLQFDFIRTISLATTQGAEISECLLVAEKIKDNDFKSWTNEWAIMADKVAVKAEEAIQSGQTITARQCYLRASNYYRSAMFPMPPSDKRYDTFLTLTRELFHKSAKLSTTKIEIIDIAMEDVKLPAYFLSSGKPNLPTLIVVNGGDSTNEELVQWIGMTAVERGWNCLIFEGPGQWSALQLNPGLYLRHDYEVPVKAVVDYLVQRNEVDANNLAILGYSLSTQLVVRAVAFEKRIKACICNGGVYIDIYEAWHSVWPKILQKAPPKVFDFIFELLEKLSPQLNAIANRFRVMFGLTKPTDIIEAWKPFNISALAPQVECPLLIIAGEAEFAQSNESVALSMMRFLSVVKSPVDFHQFTYNDGWAATHCQIGGLAPAQAVTFDWLDKVINSREGVTENNRPFDWSIVNKYIKSKLILEIQKTSRICKA